MSVFYAVATALLLHLFLYAVSENLNAPYKDVALIALTFFLIFWIYRGLRDE